MTSACVLYHGLLLLLYQMTMCSSMFYSNKYSNGFVGGIPFLEYFQIFYWSHKARFL